MKPLLAALLTSALLASCGGSPPAPTQSTPSPATAIQGTVVNWNGGAGTVAAVEGATTLSSAPLAADGTFTLPLPDAAKVIGSLGTLTPADFAPVSSCSGPLTVSDPAARAYLLSSLSVTAGARTSTVSAYSATGGGQVEGRVYLYADRAATLGGAATCAAGAGGSTAVQVSANVTLRAGWNLVAVRVNAIGSTTVTLSNAADGPTTWR